MQTQAEHISKNQIKWVRSLQQKKVRDAEGVFVAEGDKCIGELIGSFELVLLVTNTQSLTQSHLHEVTYIASDLEISQMSSLRTPQGSIAVFRKHEVTHTQSLTRSHLHEVTNTQSLTRSHLQPKGLVLALDGIQDPGNLGTIIRTCDWFGIRDIYCSRETADCYNPKVVQATMGALARVRIHYVDLVAWLTSYSEAVQQSERRSNSEAIQQRQRSNSASVPIYGTLLDGRNMYESGAIPDRQNGIIIMGNEGNGISREVRSFITHPLYIPSFSDNIQNHQATPPTLKGEAGRGSVESLNSSTVESLNVSIATAIILAEFRRG